jgi:malonyl CoA-acyl carrier protein transacylase
MTAIVFPGQGSQYHNMAIDFNNNFKNSRLIFEEIEDYTALNIRNIISSNDSKLNQTNYTQIAIFSSSIVIYETFINETSIDKIKPKAVLGHSLGEYTALVASKVLSLKDASKLIKARGDLMNSAIEPNISGMAALIGKDSDCIDKIIEDNKLKIQIANDNSPMQVVISGLIDDIDYSEKIFLSAGLKKFVKLNVSAAFHSKFMHDAQNKLNTIIDNISFSEPDIPIISNYNSLSHSNKNDIILCLKKQMANKVKWTDSIKNLEQSNINEIIEIGPGKILSGLINRISKNFVIKNIDKIEDLKQFK